MHDCTSLAVGSPGEWNCLYTPLYLAPVMCIMSILWLVMYTTPNK